MATIQSQLVCDSSTLSNFIAWAQAISNAFSTFGWAKSSDSGQVNWSTIAAVPGSNSYVYEVWQPNDGLTTFYLKVEYGNNGGTNNPALRLTLSSGTNGAGTMTGYVIGPSLVNSNAVTPPSATTQYECNFSGAAGRFGCMMWRNCATQNTQTFFAVERSLNSSGAYTGTYVTLWVCGGNNPSGQQSLVFGVGVPAGYAFHQAGGAGGWVVRAVQLGSSTSFNNSIPMDTCTPMVGYFDNPCTVCGTMYGSDAVEGVQFSTTLYGNSRTYIPAKMNGFASCNSFQSSMSALCMRFD